MTSIWQKTWKNIQPYNRVHMASPWFAHPKKMQRPLYFRGMSNSGNFHCEQPFSEMMPFLSMVSACTMVPLHCLAITNLSSKTWGL